MRVIFDANLFISFLLTKGKTISSIFTTWREKKFKVLVTDEIIVEITQVIERFIANKLIDAENGFSFIKRLECDTERIVSFSQVNKSPDKKDNRYLACAKDGQADYLVTGDKKHLLPLKKFHRTKIVSPAQFKKILLLECIDKLAKDVDTKGINYKELINHGRRY